MDSEPLSNQEAANAAVSDRLGPSSQEEVPHMQDPRIGVELGYKKKVP